MDETLIANWNSVVKPADSVYHLGDFAFGRGTDGHYATTIRRRLNGKIYLIEGNHEKAARNAAAGSFEWIKSYHELWVQKQEIILFHYGMRTWHHNLRGTWHIYGHSHNALPPYGKSFDVGVDCWDYKPISYAELEAAMAKREIAKGMPTFQCKICSHFPCTCDDLVLA